MHEVREFAGHADIRTTEVYFIRKEEDAEVAARRIQIRLTGSRGANEPVTDCGCNSDVSRRAAPGSRTPQDAVRAKTRRFLAISHSAPPEASYDAPASLPTPSPLGMTFFPFSRPHLKHFSLSVGIY